MSLMDKVDQCLSHLPRRQEPVSAREVPVSRILYLHCEDRQILEKALDRSTYLWELLCRLPRAAGKMNEIPAGDRYQKGLEEKWLMDYNRYRALSRAGQVEKAPQALLLTEFHLYAQENSVEKSQAGLLKWFLEEAELEKSVLLVSSPYVEIPVGYHDEVELIDLGPMELDDVMDVIRGELEGGSPPSDEDLARVARSFQGLTERQILMILEKCRATGYCCELDAVTEDEKTELRKRTAHFIKEEKKKLVKKDPAFVFVDYEDEEVPVGAERYKQWLALRRVLFTDPARAEGVVKGQDRGVLLTGVPGTGKTMLAGLTARELGCLPLIRFQMDKIQSHYYGDSGTNLSSYLSRIESLAPCVMLVDEVEKFMRSNDGTHETTLMLLGQFLMWMQDRKTPVFVFFTSNDVTNVPPELLRPGRLSGQFFSFMPPAETLAQMINSKLEKMPTAAAEQLFDAELRKAIASGHFGRKVVDRIGSLIRRTGRPYFLISANVDGILGAVGLMMLSSEDGQWSEERYLQAVEDSLTSGEIQPYGRTDMEHILNTWLRAKKNNYESTEKDDMFAFDHFHKDMTELPAREFSSDYDHQMYHYIGTRLMERLQ